MPCGIESLHSSWLMPLHLSITSAPQSEARMPPCLPSKVSQSPRNLKFTGPKTLSALPLFRPRPPRPPKPKLPRLPRLPKLPRPKFIDDEKGTPWAWPQHSFMVFLICFCRKDHESSFGSDYFTRISGDVCSKKKLERITFGDSQNSWFLWELGARRGGRNRPNLALLRCFDTGVPAPSATNQMFRHVLSPVPLSIKSMGVDGKCCETQFQIQNWFRCYPPQSSVPLWSTTDWISSVFDCTGLPGSNIKSNQLVTTIAQRKVQGSHNQLPSELCIQYHLSETTGWIYHNLPKWFLDFYPTGPTKKMKT